MIGRGARWLAALAAVVAVVALPGCSSDGDSTDLSLLFMQGARAATLDTAAATLTLAGVDPSVTYFADRPDRLAGQMTTTQLVDQWDAIFGDDPPNAGLQSLGVADSQIGVVVELLDAPAYDGAGNLTYEVNPIDLPDGTPEQVTFRQVSLFIDGGSTASAPASTSSAPTTQYSLSVTNDSDEFQDLVLYQDPAAVGVPDAQPLVWLSAPAWPGTTVTFVWTQDYSFYWSQTGTLEPGVTIEPGQTLPTDPDELSANQVQLTAEDGALLFGATSSAPELGQLSIVTTAAVPTGVAATGIGMSNQPVFAAPAEPNRTYTFTPQPSYRLTAGTYSQGEVLDLDLLTNDAEVAFDGTFAMRATLDRENTWTVTAE